MPGCASRFSSTLTRRRRRSLAVPGHGHPPASAFALLVLAPACALPFAVRQAPLRFLSLALICPRRPLLRASPPTRHAGARGFFRLRFLSSQDCRAVSSCRRIPVAARESTRAHRPLFIASRASSRSAVEAHYYCFSELTRRPLARNIAFLSAPYSIRTRVTLVPCSVYWGIIIIILSICICTVLKEHTGNLCLSEFAI